MKKKKLVREAFRKEVFKRDKHKCKICGVSEDEQKALGVQNYKLDAHHITDRNEMPNGGYVKENGVTLCGMHHLAAEYSIKSGHSIIWKGVRAEDLYRLIGSSFELAFEKSKTLQGGVRVGMETVSKTVANR